MKKPMILDYTFLEKQCFFALQNLLSSIPILQPIIAWTNSRYGDWLFEAGVIVCYLCYVRKDNFIEIFKNIFFITLLITATQILINTLVFKKFLYIERFSPSLALPLKVDLSKKFLFPNNHIFSNHSFPADHATTIFLVLLFSSVHLPKGGKNFLSIWGFVFLLPRLLVGAHWLSDIIIGAAMIAWVVYALTPQRWKKNLRNLNHSS